MKGIMNFLDKDKKMNEGYWTTSTTAGDADVNFSNDEVVMGGRKVRMDVDDLEKRVDGKSADRNGSGGVWGLDEPKADDALEFSDQSKMDKNMRLLNMKFDAEEDFFIQGRAGWAKTTLIKKMAKKYGYTIITVYLDKAERSDLGGIPVPVKGHGVSYQELAMPGWAAIMYRSMTEDPKKRFLLFFDEMNQADPDIQNALMPIILNKEICGQKFNNYFVGAAGNLEEENRGGVSKLAGPLASRFAPIIIWESDTEPTWRSAFDYIRKAWEKKVGKELIDKLEENKNLFKNPREIEMKIIQQVYEYIKKGVGDKYPAEDYLTRLEALAKPDISRSQKDKDLKELAEWIFNFVKNGGKVENVETGGRSSKKDREMIPEDLMNEVIRVAKAGYKAVDGVKYGVSEENFAECFDLDEVNAEQIERIKKKLKADGVKFKYKTIKAFEKDGLVDPAKASEDI